MAAPTRKRTFAETQEADSKETDEGSESRQNDINKKCKRQKEADGLEYQQNPEKHAVASPEPAALLAQVVTGALIDSENSTRLMEHLQQGLEAKEILLAAVSDGQARLARMRDRHDVWEQQRFIAEAELEEEIILNQEYVESAGRKIEKDLQALPVAIQAQLASEEALHRLIDGMSERDLRRLKLPEQFFQLLGWISASGAKVTELAAELQMATEQEAASSETVVGLENEHLAATIHTEALNLPLIRGRGRSNYLREHVSDLEVRLKISRQAHLAEFEKMCQLAADCLDISTPQTQTNAEAEQIHGYSSPERESSEDESTSSVQAAHATSGERLEKMNRLKLNRWRARDYLKDEEANLDWLEEKYEDDLRRFQKLTRCSRTKEEFDHACLETKMQQLRAVREAEEIYSKAKLEAMEFGVQADESDESAFASGSDDGCRISLENAAIQAVDTKRIHSWLEKMDETPPNAVKPKEAPEDFEELSSTEQDALLDWNDSVSVIATGKKRVKIDKWQNQDEASEVKHDD